VSVKETVQNLVVAPIAEKLRAKGVLIPPSMKGVLIPPSMTMRFKRSQFESIVLKRLPDDFFLADQCFLLSPVDAVLTGFLAEKIPSGIRIYKFVFPAFINVYDTRGNRTYHLSFSEVVPWPNDTISGAGSSNDFRNSGYLSLARGPVDCTGAGPQKFGRPLRLSQPT